MKNTKTIIAKLKEEGFDETYGSRGTITPKCSQCETLVICGIACHEHGCPNSKNQTEEEN